MESRNGDFAAAASATSSGVAKTTVDLRETTGAQLASAALVEDRMALEVGNHEKIDVAPGVGVPLA